MTMVTNQPARVKFYKTSDTGTILCDACSLQVCRCNHSITMHRTYAATSLASFPELTCEACGQRYRVSQQ